MDQRDRNLWSIAHPQSYRVTDATYSPPSLNTSSSGSIDDDTRARFNAHFQSTSMNNSKSLINNSAQDDDDDETGHIIRNPIAFAEKGSLANYHSRTKPDPPQMYDAIHQMSALSLQTNPPPPTLPSLAQNNNYYANGYTSPPISPAHGSMSEYMTPNTVPYSTGRNQYRHASSMPPVNPADQNPPCNTIYVGNLPIDAKEDELKAMFSKCRGYKRLCFRTKQQSPLCFVEFNDTTAATRALSECHGQLLSNSGTTGVRLSFSKNPLGVRSGQGPGLHGQPLSHQAYSINNMTGGVVGQPYTTPNGPPPGLAAPPGLEINRRQYGAPSPSASSISTHYGASNADSQYYGNGGHYASTSYNDSYNNQFQFASRAGRNTSPYSMANGPSLDGVLASSSSSTQSMPRQTSPRFNATAQPFSANNATYGNSYNSGRISGFANVQQNNISNSNYARNPPNTSSTPSSRLAIH